MTSGLGGRIRLCTACGRRRCIAPHTLCAGCRPREASAPRQRTAAEKARRNAQARRRRRIAGVLSGFEFW